MKKIFGKKLQAFSLIELSVVILIIGILVAGVTGGTKLISTFRLQEAQTLTLSSPVVTTKGLVLWLESSMSDSFLSTETEDGSQLTKWLDRNPQATTKLVANTTASAGITFKAKGSIYDLPAVYFNGTSSAVFTLSNGISDTTINTPNNAYTFFIVAKLDDDSASNVKTIFSNGDTAGWGYGVSGSQGVRKRRLIFAGATDVTTTTANATTNPEVISAFYTGGANGSLQLFTNGVGNAGAGDAGTTEILSVSTTTAQTPTTAFYIGNKSSAAPWTGQVAEIIIFNRSLSTKERNQIELYLGQKYNIKTATTGNIEGCAVNVAGVLTTHVSEGSSTLNCADAGYSGTVPYTCSGSALTTSGTCALIQCTINGVTGIINGTTVNYANSSTSFACNDTTNGYSGNINYTCNTSGVVNVTGSCTATLCTISSTTNPNFNDKSNLAYSATPVTISSPCQAGYTGSPTYTCTTTGAATVSGTCDPITCTVGAPAYNSKTLPYATTATAIPSTPTAACATGYYGSPTYTCTSSGAATIVTPCNAITCSITGQTGFNNKTGLAYAASPTAIPATACASGYTGSPTYTCTTTGEASITLSQCVAGSYHWVTVSTTSNKVGCEYASVTTATTLICDSSHVGKYAVSMTSTGNTISGATLTSTSPLIYAWYSEYCNGSCNLSCGASTASSSRLYQCVYP